MFMKRAGAFLCLTDLVVAIACSILLLALAGGDDPGHRPDQAYNPPVAAASNEAAFGLKRIQIPKGMQISIFAAEPMLANPVCFCIDERNRFYVAETFRIHHGVEDDREHMDWLNDDLASRSVADRLAMYRKHLGARVAEYGIEHERIRLIEDRNGDGKADRSTVFADGFHDIPDGIGAGLLARGDRVWYTCIPHLWLLRDTRGNGHADSRQALQSGYGVHVGFYGHDLHGLKFGPDGKLYFSIGDRGLHVESNGRVVDNPDSGAVLRCNPDGSDLEIVATGLRNPQELAFDQYGNLFTGDNNADHGDRARWVYVVEGGDSGWRMGYQYLTWPVDLGPWNAEKLWEPRWDGQAAYIVPPIANVADGPAGLAYYSGTGLPERYQGHFFLCDFRGSAGASGIRSFAVRPHGASFDFVDQHKFIWSVLATDVDFGTDAALYVLDWVDGWSGTGKGRIYRVVAPEWAQKPEAQSVKKLLAEGMAHRSVGELTGLLAHADMRVRQEAQFALAERGTQAIPAFRELLHNSSHELARLHAIWGLGQVGRTDTNAYQMLMPLLRDPDSEVRCQAAKVLGEGRVQSAYQALLPLLKDTEPRARFFAALSIGKLGRKEAVDPILAMLRENADKDAYLRHAGVMALVWIHDRDRLLATRRDGSTAVRLAVLLALRRLADPAVASFLSDSDPRLVVEAARAIYDVPIPSVLPELAALLPHTGLSEPLVYRALNANFRLGQRDNAAAVATFAAGNDAPEEARIEAVHELYDWAHPAGRDRLLGLWRPLPQRPAEDAAAAVRACLGGIFSGPARVRQEGARLAARLGIKEVGPALHGMVADQQLPAAVRCEALTALETLQDSSLADGMRLALADPDAHVRTAGRRTLARLQPAQAPSVLEDALQRGTQVERQGAFSILGNLPGEAADRALGRWLDRLAAGEVPLELQLDLLEAAAKRSAPAIKDKLARYEAARSGSGLIARFRETLAGGDADAGRKIFLHKEEVSCPRCHKVQGVGGEVGPDLAGIGSRQKREYLLESILDPSKEIAKGFDTLVVALTNGQIYSGIVKSEDSKQLRLITAEGQYLDIPKGQIEERQRGKSAMPEDIAKHLSKAELRDLVEFLAQLK
jgi:quinoprotein glucose dehydrogenase